MMVVQNDSAAAIAAITDAAGAAGITQTDGLTWTNPLPSCTTNLPKTITIRVRFPLKSMSGLLDPIIGLNKTLEGTAVMKCGG